MEIPIHSEAEWHALRKAHVGASEVAALFNVQPDYMHGLYGLWSIKAGLVSPPEIDNDRIKWGMRLEAPIANGCAEDQGWKIRKGGYFEDDLCPGLGASPDYIVLPPVEGKQGPGVMEIKNVDAMIHHSKWANGHPPLHIILQLQQQLAATGYQWGVVCELIGGNTLSLYHYDVHPKLIRKIRQKINAFWQSVHDKKPPPMDDSPLNGEILKTIYSPSSREIVDFSSDNELPGLCQSYKETNEKIKQLKKESNQLKNSIMDKMGNNQCAVTNGYVISISIQQEKPDRVAMPGEVIKGRSEVRKVLIKEV